MTDTTELVRFLDDLLETSRIPDYPGAVNGLQLGNDGNVRKIASCVDFSSRSVTRAAEEGADFLIVHHGMFWGGPRPLTGNAYSRIRLLLEKNIAVYASHLPLDRHPVFGNNVLLSRQLGLAPSGEFATYKGTAIGVCGVSDLMIPELFDRCRRFARGHGGDAIATGFPDGRRVGRWAVCSGGGASAETLREAASTQVETLIVGEGPHWTAVEAADLDMVIIYAGHYATETLGVAAVAEHAARKFGLEWTMVHAPTGL